MEFYNRRSAYLEYLSKGVIKAFKWSVGMSTIRRVAECKAIYDSQEFLRVQNVKSSYYL